MTRQPFLDGFPSRGLLHQDFYARTNRKESVRLGSRFHVLSSALHLYQQKATMTDTANPCTTNNYNHCCQADLIQKHSHHDLVHKDAQYGAITAADSNARAGPKIEREIFAWFENGSIALACGDGRNGEHGWRCRTARESLARNVPECYAEECNTGPCTSPTLMPSILAKSLSAFPGASRLIKRRGEAEKVCVSAVPASSPTYPRVSMPDMVL